MQKRVDSNFKVAFQSAAAAISLLVGENAHLGLQAAAEIYDRAARALCSIG